MDFDNQNNTSAPDANKSKKQPNWKRLAVTVGGLVLLAGVGALGYLYLNEKSRADDLSAQLSQDLTQTDETETTPVGSGEAEAQPTSYTSEVGKFTLSLDNKYAVVQEHDGAGEGGLATNILVGLLTDDSGNNVIVSESYGRIGINAYPKASSSSTLQAHIDATLGDDADLATEDSAVTVAGEDARVFKVSSLFNQKRIFFEHSDVIYEINISNVTDETTKQLTDVIKGFKFSL